MTARLLPAVLLLVIAGRAQAQQPVWVMLRPEAVRTGAVVTGTRERTVQPNDRAIPRRVLNEIARTGAHVRYTSRWLQAVSVDADAATVQRISKLESVAEVRPMGHVFAQGAAIPRSHVLTFSRSRRSEIGSADFDSAFYGPNWRHIKQLGVPSSHVLGFTGKNIRIAILDTGFEPAHESLSSRLVIAQRDFIYRDSNVADQPGDAATNQEQHGTEVWSILGGYKPGRIVGPAFDASFILAKVDLNDPTDADFAADEDRWVAAVEWADSMGARIISSSLAYKLFVDKASYPTSALNGDITLAARMADEAARRGILVVNAIGNFGPEPISLWTPADADSVIAVGAVDSLGQPANFSNGRSTSRGPTADGRLKPEVSAPGKGITGARASDPTSYDTNLEGTSFATPFISGIAAMFMQAWPNLTIMAVRQALILAGSRAELPDNNVGFGVPDVSSAILFPEGLTPAGITTVTFENVLTTIQPSFTWSAPLVNAAMAPVRYRLEIATDANFNNIVYTDTVSVITSLTVKRPLRPAPALWWRVVAEAFPNVKRVSRASGPFSMPDWVKLLTLNVAGSTTLTDSVRPVLRWEALTAPSPSGPLIFDVQILNAATGAPVVTMRNLTTASAQPPDALAANVNYTWRVIAKSPLGIADTVTSLGKFIVTSNQAPPATLLYQNFPNPFPRSDLGETGTHIWFDVNTTATIELGVYDLRGHLVRRLIPNAPTCGAVVLDPGQYGRTSSEANACVTTTWDATDANGQIVPKGVYILRLRANGVDQVRKILYMPKE